MRYSSSKDDRRGSFLQQLKTRLLLSCCLLIFLLLIHASVSTYITTIQNNLDTQSLALRDDSSNLLTTMIDQETGLRGYLATNNTLFLAPFHSGRTSYVSTVNHLKSLLGSSNFSNTASSLPSLESSADDWYQRYALPQLTNSQYQHQSLTQKGQTALQGKQLFDRFRMQAARLQAASQLDVRQQQSWAVNINILSTIITLLLSLLIILVLWHAFTQLDSQTQAANLAQKNREQEQINLALRIQRDELRVLNTALEETNRARSQFLAIMTHELRTPLTAILGFSQIILRNMEHEQSRNRNNIERVIKNGQHLLNIIDDALDLIRLESGHMSVTTSHVSLPSLLTEVLSSTQSIIAEKHLSLTITLDPDLDEIESDPDKLRQILLNLISNAIKFTEKGEVHITATKQPGSENEGEQIIISIHDTGIGIAPEIQERIFEAFYQGDSTITRKYGGTGLGLSIVRQLTLLLGGTLVLDSSLGQGSTFTLFLPQHPPVAEPKASLPEPQFARRS
jgi:signal transduction histidine kinase